MIHCIASSGPPTNTTEARERFLSSGRHRSTHRPREEPVDGCHTEGLHGALLAVDGHRNRHAILPGGAWVTSEGGGSEEVD